MSDIVSDLQSFNAEKLNSEPYTCEMIAKTAADEITRLREENARLREALIDTLASLVASVDLLECGGKKAAPSDKMFEQMLVDYKNTIERGRYAAAIREKRSFATEGGKDE